MAIPEQVITDFSMCQWIIRPVFHTYSDIYFNNCSCTWAGHPNTINSLYMGEKKEKMVVGPFFFLPPCHSHVVFSVQQLLRCDGGDTRPDLPPPLSSCCTVEQRHCGCFSKAQTQQGLSIWAADGQAGSSLKAAPLPLSRLLASYTVQGAAGPTHAQSLNMPTGSRDSLQGTISHQDNNAEPSRKWHFRLVNIKKGGIKCIPKIPARCFMQKA